MLHHLLLPPPLSLHVYEDKMSVCTSCVFPQCVEQGSVAGVIHRNVEQQMFSQIFNLSASIAVHHMIRLLDNLTVLVNSCTTAITANQSSVQRSSSQARTHAVTLCRVLHTVGNLTLTTTTTPTFRILCQCCSTLFPQPGDEM